MKNGDKHVLGCKKPKAMLEYIKKSIKDRKDFQVAYIQSFVELGFRL